MPRVPENQKEALFIPSAEIAVQMMKEAFRKADFNRLRDIQLRLNEPEVQNNLSGTADEFHNAAVDLTRSNMFRYAYSLVEVGIIRYPYNTDLLSDALLYGSRCHVPAESLEKHYRELQAVDKRFWTWRAYHFSAEYLMAKLPALKGDEQAQKESEILSIIQEFKKHFDYLDDQSDREKAYLIEFKFWISKGDTKKAEAALKAATDEVLPDKCPQCALKYADRMFELGRYEEVIPYAEQAMGIMEDQHSISYGYTYYILAMSLEWVARRDNGLTNPRTLSKIFTAYNNAYLYMEAGRDNLMDNIKKRVRAIEFETKQEGGIDFESMDKEKSSNTEEMLRNMDVLRQLLRARAQED